MTRWGRFTSGPLGPWVAVSAVVLLAGCGGPANPAAEASPASVESGSTAPEKPNLRVGVLSIVDTAAVQLAKSAGYFSTEGLNVELVPIQGGAVAVPQLASGELDLSWVGWSSAILAQSQGLSSFRLLPEGYNTVPGSFQIMTMPGSPVTRPQDLEGRTIATNTAKSITDLMTRSALQSAGVDASTVKFLEVPFPNMIEALQDGEVDGAIMVEPFITLAENQLKAVPVLDVTAAEATDDLSIAGIASTVRWAQQNPRTLAAFERALRIAQAEMANRRVVDQVLVDYTSIGPDTVSQLSLGSWPTTLDTTGLQRVSDLMEQFGVLNRYFDVRPMLEPAG
jgi:NitT/TauT family transport system substrate-binding protein